MTDALSLPLSQLDRPLKFRSRILDAELWLAPRDDMWDLDAPVYTAAECRILLVLRPSPADLRAIHLTKTIFSGELTAGGAREELRQRYADLKAQYDDMARQFDAGTAPFDDAKILDSARQLSHILNQAHNLD